MSLLEITEEIDRIERVTPHLRDLGDVVIQNRRLAALRAELAAVEVAA